MGVMSSPRRPYDSPLRRTQAAATRAAIIEAATRLFIERGYGATSIDEIAAAAGVSRATVFTAVGGKATLLKTAYDVALVGDDEPVPMPQRPWAQGVRRATTAAAMLEAYADLVLVVVGRIGGISEAIRGAASTEPEVRQVWEKTEEERRIGARNIVRFAEDRGGIRPGLDPEAAADVIWVLNDPGLYVRLVDRRGWTPKAYRDWLAGTMRSQLLMETDAG
jgi:AcrR family transcriptional regulator